MTRLLAIFYTVVVSLAAAWAWVTDATMLHSGREHLLPDIVLALVSSPLSLTLGALYPLEPSLFDLPFVELSFLTLSAALQAALLWWLSRKFSRIFRRHV